MVLHITRHLQCETLTNVTQYRGVTKWHLSDEIRYRKIAGSSDKRFPLARRYHQTVTKPTPQVRGLIVVRGDALYVLLSIDHCC